MPSSTKQATNRFINNPSAGFSLVELLVVIAIVGVLVAMVIPSLSKARLQAIKAVCGSQQRQIGVAWSGYANDNKQWYQETDFHYPFVSTAMSVYIGSTPVELIALRAKRVPILACPGTRAAETGINAAYIPGTITVGQDRFVSSYWYPGGWTPRVNDISRMFYGWEGLWAGQSATNVPDTSAPCPNVEFAGRVKKGPNMPSYAGMTMWIEVPSRQPIVVDGYNVPGSVWSMASSGDWFPNHADGVNVGFVDGHVEFRASPYITARHRGLWW